MTSLIQFLAILTYIASLVAFVGAFNVLAVAVYLWVDARFRGGRIGGGACPQAPPRASTTVNVQSRAVQSDGEWWLR